MVTIRHHRMMFPCLFMMTARHQKHMFPEKETKYIKVKFGNRGAEATQHYFEICKGAEEATEQKNVLPTWEATWRSGIVRW